VAAKKGADEIKAFKVEQAAMKRSVAAVANGGEDGDAGDAAGDPEADDDGVVEDVDAEKREAGRPPPVNSDYLPLPWKGRLGYVSCRESWRAGETR
jgi:UV DNA damage endonuclease